MAHEPWRLVDNQKLVVFEDDVKRDRLGPDERPTAGLSKFSESYFDRLSWLETAVGFDRLAVHAHHALLDRSLDCGA